MAEADLELFREKIRQLNAFLALSQSNPALGDELLQCSQHDEVVALARRFGFEIGRRWGERPTPMEVGVQEQADASSLLQGAPPPLGEERVEVLVAAGQMRLERIHSCAARSAPGFWYDQHEHEWVCLLQGSATIQFADEEMPRRLQTGDSLLIRARRRHRLLETNPPPGTIWLALFWRANPAL